MDPGATTPPFELVAVSVKFAAAVSKPASEMSTGLDGPVFTVD